MAGGKLAMTETGHDGDWAWRKLGMTKMGTTKLAMPT